MGGAGSDSESASDCRRLFGVGSVPGDAATLAVSIPDAADQADSTATTDEAMTLLKQARANR